MPTVRISDVIVPEVFAPYVTQRTTELSAIVQSGIVAADPAVGAVVNKGGDIIKLPYFNDLTGDDEVLSDDPAAALTPGNITADQDIAHILMRGKAWQASDLAKHLSGADPMRVIADLVAAYRARQQQKELVSLLSGVETALGAGKIHDITGGVDDAAKISLSSFAAAAQKMGDAKDRLIGVLMHSAVETALIQSGVILERDKGEQIGTLGADGRLVRFQGKRVIIDDGLPESTGDYTTYLFGAGAVAYNERSIDADEAVETDRDSLGGQDVLINRTHHIMHLRGVAWNTGGTMVGSSPSNAELALAGNWTKKYSDKQIRLVVFKHKI